MPSASRPSHRAQRHQSGSEVSHQNSDGQLFLFDEGASDELVMPRMVEDVKVKRTISATLLEEPSSTGASLFSIDFRVHDPRGEEIAKAKIGPGDEGQVRALYQRLKLLLDESEAPASSAPTLKVTAGPADFDRMLDAIAASGLVCQGTLGTTFREMGLAYRHALAAFAARDIVRTLRVDREKGSAELVDGIEHVHGKSQSQLLWIDVRAWEPLLAEYLADRFGLDRRTLDGCGESGRSLEALGFGNQVLLRTYLHSVDPSDPTRATRQELRIAAGSDFVVTWHEGESDAVRMLQEYVLARAKRDISETPLNSAQLVAELLGVVAHWNLEQLELVRKRLESDQRALVETALDTAVVKRASEARAFAQDLQSEAEAAHASMERMQRASPLFRVDEARCSLENALGALRRVSQKAGQVIERSQGIHADFRALTAHNTQVASYSLSQTGAIAATLMAGVAALNYLVPGVGEYVRGFTAESPWFSLAAVALLAAGAARMWKSVGALSGMKERQNELETNRPRG